MMVDDEAFGHMKNETNNRWTVNMLVTARQKKADRVVCERCPRVQPGQIILLMITLPHYTISLIL